MVLKIDNIGEYLKSHDIKPSYQRLKVFDYLLKNMDHPSVDRIFNALIDEIPTLSKSTVYNTLRLFQEKGIVGVVNVEDTEARYDVVTEFHGHFKCNICGGLYDFPIGFNKDIADDKFSKFVITETHFYHKGICGTCSDKMN